MLTIDQLLKLAKGQLKIFNNLRLQADRPLSEKLTVFIPDMHILEKGVSDDFYDGKQENEDRFLALLDFLLALRKKEGTQLEIVQLGDMMDLWQAKWNANGIVAAYPSIVGLMEKMGCLYVVGNHDIDLWRWYHDQGETFGRMWRRNLLVGGKVRAVVEHGFQADLFNDQARWTGIIGQIITKIVGMMEYIDPDIDVQLGNVWDAIVGAFTKYNVFTPTKDPERFNAHEYTNYYVNLLKKYNAGQTNDHWGPDRVDASLAVIGHTHKPRLVQAPEAGRTYYLMDCGSWVNGSNQLGVVSGDDMALCAWG